MINTIKPHEVVWTNEKSEYFWAYVAANKSGEDSYFGKHAGRSVIETVKRYVRLNGRILDYGCGPGMFMEHLFAEGIASAGLDFSKESLDILNNRLNSNSLFRGAIHVGNLPTPIKDKSLDIVFFLETIEHLLPDQIHSTVAELSRIVRPGGHIIVTTPNNEDLSKEKVICPDCGGIFHRWQHITSFTVESMTHLMSDYDFEKVICKPTLFCEYRRPLRLLLVAANTLRRKPLPNLLYIGKKR